MNTTETDLIFERYTQTKILPQYNEGVISNVVKSVAAKFDDAAVKKLIGAVNDSTAIEVIIELDKLSPKKRANLHRAITSWVERNSNNAAVKQLTRLQTSLKESVDLEDAPEDDQFGGMEPEEDESVGDFDEFIGKAEKFVDEIGDDGLEFLANLRKDQFEVLMDVVSDQRGYRDQIPAEDYES
tara:strand:- start:452 stop:1003 length:552 start_codon:yes stop_codon:yes gene_type:complete